MNPSDQITEALPANTDPDAFKMATAIANRYKQTPGVEMAYASVGVDGVPIVNVRYAAQIHTMNINISFEK